MKLAVVPGTNTTNVEGPCCARLETNYLIMIKESQEYVFEKVAWRNRIIPKAQDSQQYLKDNYGATESFTR